MKAILILIGFLCGAIFLAAMPEKRAVQVREAEGREGHAGFC